MSEAMTKPKRLTKDTDTYKLMVSKLENGDWDMTANPKDIWQSEPLFYMWDLTKWRTCWNRLKAEMGVMTRAAPAPGNVSVAGASTIAEARSMLENAAAAANGLLPQGQQGPTAASAGTNQPNLQAQANQHPSLQVPPAPKKAAVGGPKSDLEWIMPPLAQALAQPLLHDPSNPFSQEKVAESPKLEYKPPHLVVKLEDARARRDQVIAIVQCLTGCPNYYAEVRANENFENKVLAVKVGHHLGLEMAEVLLRGLQKQLGKGQLVLASRAIDAKIGELKGGDNSKQIQWTCKLELPIAVSTTFVHQGMYSFDDMDFLVIMMEAQEANKMQQKSDFGQKVSLEEMPTLDFDI